MPAGTHHLEYCMILLEVVGSRGSILLYQYMYSGSTATTPTVTGTTRPLASAGAAGTASSDPRGGRATPSPHHWALFTAAQGLPAGSPAGLRPGRSHRSSIAGAGATRRRPRASWCAPPNSTMANHAPTTRHSGGELRRLLPLAPARCAYWLCRLLHGRERGVGQRLRG